jgi:tetratricopeptide (TPR) repeat protein
MNRDFDLSAGDLPHVVRVCHLVRGMPLGILLAAAWVKMLTLSEIAEEIGRSIDFLETDLRDLPDRQRSMRAVFDHSWRLLPEREREAIQALSVFRGGFVRLAAEQVTGVTVRVLMNLIDKSLLQRMATGRYEMHELLRQYAAEGLCQSSTTSAVGDLRGDVEGDRHCLAGRGRDCVAVDERHCAAVHDRHSAYYATALQEWESELKGPRQQATLAEMDVEIANARTAWEWAIERGQTEQLDRATEGLGLFYQSRSRHQEGESAFRAAAERLEAIVEPGVVNQPKVVPADGLRVLAKMLTWQGRFAWQLARTESAHHSLRQSLNLLERPELAGHDTRQEKAFILLWLGLIGFDTGREDPRQRWEESLSLFRAIDSQWWAGKALRMLAVLDMDSGDHDGSKRRFAESLEIYRSLGDPRQRAATGQWLSAVYAWQGQFEYAKRLTREALQIMQELGAKEEIAFMLEGLAWHAGWTGRFAESESLMERCLAICDDLGFRGTTVMHVFSTAKLHQGQYKQARALAQEELDLLQERGRQRMVGIYLELLGIVALPEKAYSEADQWFEKCLAVYQEFDSRGWLANARAIAAYAARGLGRPAQARRQIRQALQMGTKLDSWLPIVLGLPALALLLADEGELERAVELYALASRYPHVSNSRWFEDVAGRDIAAVAATLPADAAAAARERGQLLAELGE